MKRLDTFVISKFLQLFAGAFFVCLFVFMMQFTWRYVDDLVGKGLTLDILGQFFAYMALGLAPQALPLAVLLASLITFGNMGESLELLSMKAAGVSLIRVMRPLIFLVVLLGGFSLYYQNTTAPDAQKSLRQLLISMKQSQPAVEIPEGIFYNGVPNVNLYVEHKVPKTGMLYQVIIYKTDQGFDKAQIVLADSGRMEMTSDKLHLRLALWNGQQFQSLQNDGSMQNMRADSPYDRETFAYKEFLIDFDSNFNLMDGDLLKNIPATKTMQELQVDADSMSASLDSAALAYVETLQARQSMRSNVLTRKDSVRLKKEVKKHPVNLDTLFANASPERLKRARSMANVTLQQMNSDLTWKVEIKKDEEKWIRRHWIEWHTRLTLAFACIFFFFIGAPLGAIIRKGGLGTPTIVSVSIFIFYYIFNTAGMKMAREGSINMVIGMWASTFILAPTGAYLTFMANRDSQVFNIDAYVSLFRRIFGLRTGRHLTIKEVIIQHPDYLADRIAIARLREEIPTFRSRRLRLLSRLSLISYLLHRKDTRLFDWEARLDATIEDLHNTRDIRILHELNAIPYVSRRHLVRDLKRVEAVLARVDTLLAAQYAPDELMPEPSAEPDHDTDAVEDCAAEDTENDNLTTS